MDAFNIYEQPNKGYGYIIMYIDPQGKKYVHKTIKRMKKEFILKDFRDSSYFTLEKAVLKYGWDNFKKALIGIYPEKTLDYFESYYIKKEGSEYPNGYNLKCNEEKDLSAVLGNQKNIFINEDGIVIIDTRTNAPKEVEQFDKSRRLIRAYASITEAEGITGIRHISECVNGIRQSAGGYYWRFKQGEDYGN